MLLQCRLAEPHDFEALQQMLELYQYELSDSDVAVIRYRAQLRISVKGLLNAPSGRFWHVDLYEKRNGRWQAAWSQATQIQ
jgi:hypothetical protein